MNRINQINKGSNKKKKRVKEKGRERRTTGYDTMRDRRIVY